MSAGDSGFKMLDRLTDRQAMVLAALAASPGDAFAPVQVQKLFFLLDENLHDEMGGRQFAFQPYDFGPFDKAVYRELDYLASVGAIEIYNVTPSAGGRRYKLTPAGVACGADALGKFSLVARAYMKDVSEWVRKLSFAQLVGSIYKAYPHMREKSIFVE